MKSFYFLIIVIFINEIYNANYDLKNGVKEIFNLDKNDEYNFYISMNQFQAAKIYINFNEIKPDFPIPFSNIEINEYLTRDGSPISNSKINFNKIYNQNILVIESDYFFNDKPKNYIALTVKTNSTVGEINILIDIFGGYYEIIEGEYLKFNKFYSGFPYYLASKAKFGNLLNINLLFSKIEELDIDNFTIIEYKDINHTIILNSIDYPISKQSSENLTNVDLSYAIKNSQTNIVIIKLYPKNRTVSYLQALIKINNFYFYLNLNQSITLNKLNQNSYYFSLEINKNLLANISLNINYNNKTEFPFENLTIYETENAFSTNHLEYNSVRITSASQSIIYKSANELTNFLKILFKPQFEFEQIKIIYNNAKELITTYNLINGDSKDIINMQPKIPYYFDIKGSFLKTLYISFIINNSLLNPIYDLNIYENLNKENNNYSNVENYIVPWIRNENQLKANLSHTIYDNYTTNLTLYTKPNYFIKSMLIKIDIGGETYKLKSGSFSKYFNLSNKFRYFFVMDSNKNKNASIDIKLKNNYSSFPLEHIIIHEMSNKIIKNKINESFSHQDKDGEINIRLFHKINFDSIDELMLEIHPIFNLEYINICINLDYYNKGSETVKKDDSTSITVVAILGVVIAIGCILFIFIMIKKKSHDSNLIDISPGNGKNEIELLANSD